MGLYDYVSKNSQLCRQSGLNVNDGFLFEDPMYLQIKEKLQTNGIKMGSIQGIKFFSGLRTGENGLFVIPHSDYDALISADPKNQHFIYPCMLSRKLDVFMGDTDTFIILIPKGTTDSLPSTEGVLRSGVEVFKLEYSVLYNYLCNRARAFPNAMTRSCQGDYWWETEPINIAQYTSCNKLLISCTTSHVKFALDMGHRLPVGSNINVTLGIGHDDLLVDIHKRLNDPLMLKIVERFFAKIGNDHSFVIRTPEFMNIYIPKDSEDVAKAYGLTPEEVEYIQQS